MRTKTVLAVFIAGFIHATTFEQPVTGLQKDFGGSLFDQLTSVYLTRDGGYIFGRVFFIE